MLNYYVKDKPKSQGEFVTVGQMYRFLKYWLHVLGNETKDESFQKL